MADLLPADFRAFRTSSGGYLRRKPRRASDVSSRPRLGVHRPSVGQGVATSARRPPRPPGSRPLESRNRPDLHRRFLLHAQAATRRHRRVLHHYISELAVTGWRLRSLRPTWTWNPRDMRPAADGKPKLPMCTSIAWSSFRSSSAVPRSVVSRHTDSNRPVFIDDFFA